MPDKSRTELSIIVPVLNEERTVGGLLTLLGGQEGVVFEVMVCDGGSGDDTLEMARCALDAAPFPGRIVRSGPGRGRQMNAGAAESRGEWLLFLHVDSRFEDSAALRKGVDALRAAVDSRGDYRVAGRFALRFEGRGAGSPGCCAFFQGKARLNRPGCIHGDQGFLLSRSFFEDLGGYREDQPILEDETLAAAVFEKGAWMLLPAAIGTSARRFESEGWFERQLLNALILNFNRLQWAPFFSQAPGIYRQQKDCGPLRLLPFFELIAALLRREPRWERFRLWRGSGDYVNDNAWQVALALDIWRFRMRPEPPIAPAWRCLNAFDGWFRVVVENPVGRWGCTAAVYLWFHLYKGLLRWRARGTGSPPGLAESATENLGEEKNDES
ncbi:MAG: TIGR04283 family arsenosugar biosynthesis glycosyltransferase [Deltaproteobacteria bacterium]|nr:TIGR04283 family arsenosugar biosynthesis glycosyltransferase [Deltaproteobacteria bacterium]